MASPLQCSEAGNILEFTIFSNKTGRSADVGPGVVTLQYFESILDSSVRFIAVIVDSGNSDKGGEAINVLQDLKLEGSEKCHITIADNQNNKLKFADDNAMYIKEIRNIISSSESTVYTLELMNKEMIANDLLSTEVYRRFDGEISQSAEIILKEILKTTKTVILDATSNTFNFIGQGKKPFRLLSEIATKGVSQASKQSAGYLIFETYDGYNFRSIDNLFEDEEGHKSYVFNDSVKLPAGYDGKILRYDADSTIDVEKNLSTGTYGSRMETVNTYTQIFNTKAQEIDTEEQKVHGGLEIPTLSKEFQEQFVTDGALLSRRFTKIDSVGELPEGNGSEQLDKKTEQNLALEDVIVQSSMTYNKLFTMSLKVTITGDYSVRAGQVIHCDFPEQGSKKETGVDKELSGKYIVCDVCTQLTSKSIYTRIHLVRDSFGRQANSSTGAQGGTSLANASKGNLTNGDRALPGVGKMNIFDATPLFNNTSQLQGLFDNLNAFDSNQTKGNSGETTDKTRVNADLSDQSANGDDDVARYLDLY
tara:strand:+ start:13901 stop:15505 length:1605 start_codon:yes stop_codon:yes gene_type:complete